MIKRPFFAEGAFCVRAGRCQAGADWPF